MAVDPRSPVVVGVGQLTRRPRGDRQPSLDDVQALPEPAEMMAEALRRAQTDSGASGDLLARARRVAVVSILSWPYANPAGLLAGLVGAEPSDTVLTTAGGNSPQMLVHRAAEDIAAGRLDVALIAGAEAMYARRLARAAGGRTEWTHQPQDTPAPRVEGDGRPGSSDAEGAASLVLPVQFYPLFENALRRHAGETIEDHQQKVSELWSRFSDVAAGNPHAWSPVARRAAEIRAVGPDNRMIGFPYPKLM